VPGTLVSIRDQGIGIPTADLPYLFEPFRRGSNIQPEMGGTGLGLVSTRYVVEQHGGSISVTSEEGSGSTFAVWLPLHELP
jgi:signal transduction histidine kinase